MESNINNQIETCQSTRIPLYTLRIWCTLIQKLLRTVGEFLPTLPLNFRIANLTAWTLYNRQQTNFGTFYVVAQAYSLEQQNAGRAHAVLCHASSVNVL